MYMKYKLLKLIEPKENSISIWGTFDSIWWFVHMDNWLQLSVELLIEQGFIEEVKETPKPRWKIGDPVVFGNSQTKYPLYQNIKSVCYNDESKCFMYNEWTENKFREPTPEELITYFK